MINRLFLKSDVEISEQETKPEVLDNVWIKDGDKIYSGCIWDISRRKITVTFYKDYEGFIDETFLKSDIKDNSITKKNLTIYFKKSCFTD